LGKQCTIKKEICGAECTSYDGIADRDIIIKKNDNIWDGLINKVPGAIWCPTCRGSYIMKIKALADLTNLSIGEIKKPRDPLNLKNFMGFANCVYDNCKSKGVCV